MSNTKTDSFTLNVGNKTLKLNLKDDYFTVIEKLKAVKAVDGTNRRFEPEDEFMGYMEVASFGKERRLYIYKMDGGALEDCACILNIGDNGINHIQLPEMEPNLIGIANNFGIKDVLDDILSYTPEKYTALCFKQDEKSGINELVIDTKPYYSAVKIKGDIAIEKYIEKYDPLDINSVRIHFLENQEHKYIKGVEGYIL